MSRDYEDDDVIFDTQWIALKNAINGNGVLDTAPTLIPGGLMDVDIGAGNVYRNDLLVAITPGSVTFTVAVAKSKWGVIWIPAGGVPYMKMGAEADRPLMPEPNDWNDILLGGLIIPLGMTVITAADIIQMYFTTELRKHIADVANPHAVTYTQAGAEQAFAKNTAFNKNYGTGSANIPEIDSTLGNTKNVITTAAGKLATETILLPSGTIIPAGRFDLPVYDSRAAPGAEPRFETSSNVMIRAGPDTNVNFITGIFSEIVGMKLYVRSGFIVYGDTPAYDVDCKLFAGSTGTLLDHVGIAPTVIYGTWILLSTSGLGSLNYPLIRGNNVLGVYYLTKCWLEYRYVVD